MHAIALAFAIAGAAPSASAHLVFPDFIELRTGGKDLVYVSDCCDCAADITVSSPSGLELIHQIDMQTGAIINDPDGDQTSVTVANRVDQWFLITAAGPVDVPAVSELQVCWVGVDFPGPGNCLENNCGEGDQFPIPVVHNTTVVTDDALPSAWDYIDPVNTKTGELFLPYERWLSLGGPMLLDFETYYASRLAADAVHPSALGSNWRHPFDWRLRRTGFGVEIFTPKGRVIRFEKGPFDAEWSLVLYDDIPYQLVESGVFFVLADPVDGRMYTFDPAGKLTRIADQNGNALTLFYTGSPLVLSQVTDGVGRSLIFTYAGGRLASVSDGTRTVSFTYDSGTLTTVTDPLGNMTTYAYDGGHPITDALLASVTMPDGNTHHLQNFDAEERVATQSDTFGNTYGMSYDDVSGETTITDPLGASIVHVYNDECEIVEYRDADGHASTMSQDARGRTTEIVDREGGVTSVSYHEPSGMVASITHADGSTTSYGYTARMVNTARAPAGTPTFTFYDLTSVMRADGAMESFTYDAAGNQTSWTDPAGNVWTYDYSVSGHILSVGNPEGGVTTYTYNPDGTVATMTGATGETTTYTYDALLRPTTITYADATTRTIVYDANDRVLSITDELGRVAAYAYDANRNITTGTPPNGQAWSYGYDSMDRLLSIANPGGGVATFAYDAMGRVEVTADENGDGLSFGFDARGNEISVTDAAGNLWSRTYDREGILTSQSDPLGNVATFESDALGRLVRTTTPLGHTFELSLDPIGRMIAYADALAQVTTFTRDARGYVTGVQLPEPGVVTGYQRNGFGQITAVTDPGGGLWAVDYDVQGRRIADSDPLGNTNAYTYTDRDLVSSMTLPGGLGTVQFTHDAARRLVERSYSDGLVLQYAYDTNDHLTSANGVSFTYDAVGRMASSNGLGIARDAAGRMTTLTVAPGKSIDYAYDARGLVTSVTDWIGGSTDLAYDAAGRLVSISRPNSITTTYTHDADSRLVRIEESGLSDIDLTLDPLGRVVATLRDVPLIAIPVEESVTRGFDAAYQADGFSYDAMGRVTADGTRTYLWDLASRLVSYDAGAGPIAFTRDAYGNLLSRTEAGATREYVWNYAFELPSVSVVRGAGGAPARGSGDLRYFVHTPSGELLYMIDASTNNRRFYHYDEAGNTMFLTDDAGLVTDSYAYSAYGELLAETGATDHPFTYQGRLGAMREGQLYHMRARVYDPETRRFLSRDPVEGMGPRSVNPYQAFYANPLMFADPTGWSPDDATATVPPGKKNNDGNPQGAPPEEQVDTPEAPPLDLPGLAVVAPWAANSPGATSGGARDKGTRPRERRKTPKKIVRKLPRSVPETREVIDRLWEPEESVMTIFHPKLGKIEIFEDDDGEAIYPYEYLEQLHRDWGKCMTRHPEADERGDESLCQLPAGHTGPHVNDGYTDSEWDPADLPVLERLHRWFDSSPLARGMFTWSGKPCDECARRQRLDPGD